MAPLVPTLQNLPTTDRVLSIQSHVVFGYVGGKAAVFPLQCLGYDVDVVNTVNFSNHAGYGRSGGSKTSAAELTSIFKSMQQNELLFPRRLLTGYIPGAESLSAIAGLARKLKGETPGLIYLLDPVMGDAGRLYVAPDVVPVYRSMLSLATIITPNWFEVETLTDTRLISLSALQRALNILHKEYHVPNVVITSIPLSPWLLAALPEAIRPPPGLEHLLCISSSSPSPKTHPNGFINGNGTKHNPHSPRPPTPRSVVHAQTVPLLPGYFSGVGDLFSALLLAHFSPSPSSSATAPAPPSPSASASTPLSHAASLALTKTHALLLLTHAHAAALPREERLPSDDEADSADPLRRTRRMRGRELRLVQGQDIIRGVGKGVGAVRWMEEWGGFWDLEPERADEHEEPM